MRNTIEANAHAALATRNNPLAKRYEPINGRKTRMVQCEFGCINQDPESPGYLTPWFAEKGFGPHCRNRGHPASTRAIKPDDISPAARTYKSDTPRSEPEMTMYETLVAAIAQNPALAQNATFMAQVESERVKAQGQTNGDPLAAYREKVKAQNPALANIPDAVEALAKVMMAEAQNGGPKATGIPGAVTVVKPTDVPAPKKGDKAVTVLEVPLAVQVGGEAKTYTARIKRRSDGTYNAQVTLKVGKSYEALALAFDVAAPTATAITKGFEENAAAFMRAALHGLNAKARELGCP